MVGVYSSSAQQTSFGTGSDFTAQDYFDPPHQNQKKWLLRGDKGKSLPNGRVLINGLNLETYRETGEREIVLRAPECLYDSVERQANSAGRLEVQNGDGKFFIEGEGFLWGQTNNSLTISNRVHTIIHEDLLKPPSANTRTNVSAREAAGIEIFCDQFDYDGKSGLAIYRENVRVTGTNLVLTAGILTVKLPTGEGQLESITAERTVIFDQEGIHATGEQAIYSTTNGLVHVSGQPTWRAEPREGRGDELIIDRTNKIFRANGHAYMKMQGESAGGSAFLPHRPSTSTNLLAATNQFVEVFSDHYEIRTNNASFVGGVQARELADDQLKGKLTSEWMSVSFAASNQVQNLVAENNVVIEQNDQRLTGRRAVYESATGLLQLTGHPAWQADPREGKGDFLVANLQRDEMTVRGNASMKLPASEINASTTSATNIPSAAQSFPATNEFAEVFSEEYDLKPDVALFRAKCASIIRA